MQIQVFTIPILNESTMLDEMNKFLRSKKVIDVDKQLVSSNGQAYWTFCVRYLEGAVQEDKDKNKPGVDYKEVLDEKTFGIFSQLRVIRKQVAEKNAVPVYSIFTNEELASIAKLEQISLDNMLKINGIGAKKLEKYGVQFMELVATTKQNET